jgi:aspartate aminotransferase
MTLKIASRLDPIKPSITLAVTAKAAKLKADGIDVVSFGAGEPDFDTPDHIKDAARASLDKGVGKYTEVAGIAALRKAIAAELSRVHAAKIAPEDVLVSCGAKHSLYNLFMALLDPGDEVIVPAPYWVSYPDMVMLAGGKPVIVAGKAEDDFAVTAAAVAAACTPKTRAIVLNNPSNRSRRSWSSATCSSCRTTSIGSWSTAVPSTCRSPRKARSSRIAPCSSTACRRRTR